ncbi:hypothetical protein MACH26_21260 [Planctobacterium marinum]|uniref:Uncharacterized protein n=1 Tax=Planctobacterium marinum TaxID=1631968 RepID=A0AA48KUM6_9ALTE|nr:hypothetical protein MACH26_21260 [Planctobacterium marinum]
MDYNQSLRATEDEQMLLNIVRLRYRDRMYFLEADTVTTQFSYSASIQPGINWIPGLGSNESLNNRLAIEERPTVTYRPLRGKDFVERILTPVNAETLILLSNSGWPISRILRTCLERINNLENNYQTDQQDFTVDTKSHQTFIDVVYALRELELANLVAGAKDPVSKQIVLQFKKKAHKHPAFMRLAKILSFDPSLTVLPLVNAIETENKDVLTIQARSFDSIMFFLSQSVEVPDSDLQERRVPLRNDEQGTVFDEARVTKDLFRIHSSIEKPDKANVAVFYRNNWFYIDDSDSASKSTFSLLTQIFALQSGSVQQAAPILTIPLGN